MRLALIDPPTAGVVPSTKQPHRPAQHVHGQFQKNMAASRQIPDAVAPALAVHAQDPRRWPALAAMIGRDIAMALTAALERVNALATSGQIDRDSLEALREDSTQAREVGIASQPLGRFAVDRLCQTHERPPLGEMLAMLLTHSGREIHTRGLALTSQSIPTEIVVHDPLSSSLLGSVIDQAPRHANSEIHPGIDHSV